MKLILFLLSSTMLFAHDYYFAFAEVSYNENSKKFEVTLTVSTHDLEWALSKENINKGELEKLVVGTDEAKIVTNYLLEHFEIKSDSKVSFELLGLESNVKGDTYFYLESQTVAIDETITVKFDLMMKVYKQQQNKITFYYKGKSYTKPFLYTQRTQIINLN